jgi:hypothetical protein
LSVLAVILSAAKDPEALYLPIESFPFLHGTFLARTCRINPAIINHHRNQRTGLRPKKAKKIPAPQNTSSSDHAIQRYQ